MTILWLGRTALVARSASLFGWELMFGFGFEMGDYHVGFDCEGRLESIDFVLATISGVHWQSPLMFCFGFAVLSEV